MLFFSLVFLNILTLTRLRSECGSSSQVLEDGYIQNVYSQKIRGWNLFHRMGIFKDDLSSCSSMNCENLLNIQTKDSITLGGIKENNVIATRHDDHDHQHKENVISKKVGIALAFAAWFIITICGFLGLLLVPLKKYKRMYVFILQFLTALGFSSLIGDVTYHLLPHALLHIDDHTHGNDSTHRHDDPHQLMKFNVLLLGIVFLYFVEIVLRLCPFTRDRECGCHPNKALTSVTVVVNKEQEVTDHDSHDHHHHCVNIPAAREIRKTSAAHRLGAGVPPDVTATNNAQVISPCPGEESECDNHVHIHDPEDKCTTIKKTKNVVLILLFADMCHHVLDGVAIGAAFTQREVYAGISLSLAIFFHELPHKVGDIALLVKSGYSEKKATLMVIGTSSVSLIGLAVGCSTTFNFESSSVWINLFTAGMFIYISLVLMMSQMLNAITKPELHMFTIILSQFLGIVLGTAIMFALAKLEAHHH